MASEVKIVVRAVDQASGVLKGIAGGMAGVAAAAAGLAVAFAGTAFAAGNELQKGFNNIIIGTGASGEALKGLQEVSRNVFRSVAGDFDTVTGVVSELNTRLGLADKDLEVLTGTVMNASRLLGGDAQKNAALFSRVIGDWGVPVEDANELMDKLFVATQMSGIGFESLASTMVQFGAPLRTLGFGVDDTIGILSKWEKEGVNTSLMLGSLRIAANELAESGRDLTDGFWENVDAIKAAETETEALTMAQEMFGRRAAVDMAKAIREGRFDMDDYTEALEGAVGTIGEITDATLTWSDKLDILKNRTTLALEPIGSYLVDAASALMDEALPAFDKFVEVVNVLWGELVTMWNESERVAQVMEILQDIFDDIAAQVIPFLLEQFEKLNAWYIENEELINDFKDTMIAAFEALKPVISDVVGIILTLLDGLIDYVLGMVKTIMQIATGDWAGAWETYKETAANAFDSIGKAVEQFVDMVAGWFGSSAEEIKEVWSNNFKMLGEITEKVMQIISKEVTSKLDTAKGAFSGIISKIKDLIKFFKDLAAAAANFKLPPLLTPGSPTPFEMGLRGINDAMKEINQKSLPAFTGGFGGMNMASEFPAPAMAAAGMGGGASTTVVINYAPSFSTASLEEMQAFVPVVENAMRQIRGYD